MSESLLVWLLQTGEPLHLDAGSPRPMRAMNLANSLVAAGHRVVIWSSAFYHQEKRHRSKGPMQVSLSSQLEIRLVPSPGYRRNIGPDRLWDHAVLARNLRKMLRDQTELPDVAFIGYPPIEVAGVMSTWLADRKIPCLLDVKDQWPSLFLDALPRRLRPLGSLALWPYFYSARATMRRVDGLSSMANGFLQWALDFAGRTRCNNDGVFPLASPPAPLMSAETMSEADLWWDSQGVTKQDYSLRLVFIGSHMSVFDFEPVRSAAALCLERGLSVQFVICGDGGSSVALRAQLSGLPNIVFPGWIDRIQIESLAARSDAAMAPYRNIDNFIVNIPNKVVDSFALGLPVLCPLQGEVANLIAKHDVGLRYDTDSGKSLMDCIEVMNASPELRQRMADHALTLHRRQFEFKQVYGALVDHLVGLGMAARKARCHTKPAQIGAHLEPRSE